MNYNGNRPIVPESAIPVWMREAGRSIAAAAFYGTFAAAITGFISGYVGGTVLQREFSEDAAKSIAIEAIDFIPRGMNPDSVIYYPLRAGSLIGKTGAQMGFSFGDIIYDLFIDKHKGVRR